MKYFELPENVDVTTYDGRAYLNTIDVPGSTNRELFASNNDDMIEIFSTNLQVENNYEIKKLMNIIYSELVKYV